MSRGSQKPAYRINSTGSWPNTRQDQAVSYRISGGIFHQALLLLPGRGDRNHVGAMDRSRCSHGFLLLGRAANAQVEACQREASNPGVLAGPIGRE